MRRLAIAFGLALCAGAAVAGSPAPAPGALAPSAAATAPGPAAHPGLPADLAAAAKAYDQAQMNCDRAELERLLAPDYRLFNSSGEVQDKASFIADSVAPGFRMNPFRVEEPLEKVVGDTALLGGMVRLSGTYGGKPFSTRLRFMDVWAKRGGRWQVIFTQATRIPGG